jgi:uncharacterized membrane protein YidH (DUF202 family)
MPAGAEASREAGEAAPGPCSGRASQESETVELAYAIERALMDADRTMLQIIATALSMIGMGVTIYSFFTGVATRFAGGDDVLARRIGLALLSLGLVLLITGIGSQVRYRFALIRQHKVLRRLVGRSATPRYRPQPTFAIAAALLLIGSFALATILTQQA